MLSESIQDYLKAIYELRHEREQPATTNELAARLNIAAASVTGMLKKLADMKLVAYAPYQGAVLTPAGEKIALEVIRHHRLIELYLTEAMGYSWDQGTCRSRQARTRHQRGVRRQDFGYAGRPED